MQIFVWVTVSVFFFLGANPHLSAKGSNLFQFALIAAEELKKKGKESKRNIHKSWAV